MDGLMILFWYNTGLAVTDPGWDFLEEHWSCELRFTSLSGTGLHRNSVIGHRQGDTCAEASTCQGFILAYYYERARSVLIRAITSSLVVIHTFN